MDVEVVYDLKSIESLNPLTVIGDMFLLLNRCWFQSLCDNYTEYGKSVDPLPP